MLFPEPEEVARCLDEHRKSISWSPQPGVTKSVEITAEGAEVTTVDTRDMVSKYVPVDEPEVKP